jgi:hypothetical protein
MFFIRTADEKGAMEMSSRIQTGFVLLVVLSSAVWADGPLPVTHEVFQAVNTDGVSTFTGPEQVILEGIILNSPEHFLDPAAGAPAFMGGQWQPFIQSEGDDHAGTALWMGQYYGNLPFLTHPDDSYNDSEWVSELCRLNHDPNTGYLFHPGDRVRVTGKHLPYRGKRNINENHFIDPEFDFTIELLDPSAGLPQPEVVTLDELKDVNNNFIFDPTRNSGCEYYQSRLIRINGVSFVNAANWGPDATLEITNGSGKTFPVLLGFGAGFNLDPNDLSPVFDVIGILDQEDDSAPYTGGYRLFVPNYDGNGLVLNDRGTRRGNLPGDVNRDGKVDLCDLAEIAADWLKVTPGIGICP